MFVYKGENEALSAVRNGLLHVKAFANLVLEMQSYCFNFFRFIMTVSFLQEDTVYKQTPGDMLMMEGNLLHRFICQYLRINGLVIKWENTRHLCTTTP